MKVIWSHRDLGINFDRPFRWWLLAASAYSFKRFAPNFKRVFYGDSKTLEYLRKNMNTALLWDEIIQIEFNEVLLEQGNKYWCSPKSYVSTLQSEPFAVVDGDIILCRPILDWLNPSKYYGSPVGNMLGVPDHIKDAPSTAFADIFSKIGESEPGYRLLASPERGVNGGFIFYADPAIGALVSYTMLSIQTRILSNIQKYKEELYPENEELWSWIPGTVVEEGLYNRIFDLLGIPLEYIRENVEEDMWVLHQFDKNGLSFDDHIEPLTRISKLLQTNLWNYFKGSSDYRQWLRLRNSSERDLVSLI